MRLVSSPTLLLSKKVMGEKTRWRKLLKRKSFSAFSDTTLKRYILKNENTDWLSNTIKSTNNTEFESDTMNELGSEPNKSPISIGNAREVKLESIRKPKPIKKYPL